MDSVINWIMVILVCVFDPLAIILVVTASWRFEKLKKKLPPPLPIIEETPITPPDDEPYEVYVKEEEEENAGVENLPIVPPVKSPVETPQNLSLSKKKTLMKETAQDGIRYW